MFSELFFPDSKKLVVPYDRDAHARTHICGGSMEEKGDVYGSVHSRFGRCLAVCTCTQQ